MSTLAKIFFFKSRNQSGGRGIFKVQIDTGLESLVSKKPDSFHRISYAQLKEIWNSRNSNFTDFFLEREAVGPEYTVDIFIGETKQLFIPRKRLLIRNGISQINLIEHKYSLIEVSKNLTSLLGLKGLFGLQFIEISNDKYALLECNPRLQGTNIASILAGSNLIEYAIKSTLEIDYKVLPPRWNSIFRRESIGTIEFL